MSFEGFYKNTKIHIDIDSIKFDHSLSTRYFIEAEVLTKEKEEVKKIKEFIRDFLRELLKIQELVESPGMFTMAFEKK